MKEMDQIFFVLVHGLVLAACLGNTAQERFIFENVQVWFCASPLKTRELITQRTNTKRLSVTKKAFSFDYQDFSFLFPMLYKILYVQF